MLTHEAVGALLTLHDTEYRFILFQYECYEQKY